MSRETESIATAQLHRRDEGKTALMHASSLARTMFRSFEIHQIDAHCNGKHEALKDIYNLRTRFLGEHLGRRVGPFTGAVKAGAQCGFYRELAALTARFVRMQAGGGKVP